MLSANRRRARNDRLAGFLIRGTSLIVLAAVAGMLIQLIWTAVPLFKTIDINEISDPQVLDGPVVLAERSPDWVSPDVAASTWLEQPSRRSWAAVSADGRLIGEFSERTTPDGEWSNPRNLPSISLAPGSMVRFVRTPRDSLLTVSAAGAYRIFNAEGVLSHEGTLKPNQTWQFLTGAGGMLGASFDSLDHWHWVRSGNAAYFEEHWHLSIPQGLKHWSVSPEGKNILFVDNNGGVTLVSLLTGEQLFHYVQRPSVNAVGWSGSNSFFTEDEHNTRRHWALTGNLDNIDFERLFAPVQYVNDAEGAYVWQPLPPALGQAARLSITPLLLGTLKASVLALLLAVPIGVGAAAFVGYFMRPSYRNRIKPVIEMLAAFPTVVLGAVFALLIAPYFLSFMASWLGAMLITPLGIIIAATIWRRLPSANKLESGFSSLPLWLLPLGAMLLLLGGYLGHYVEAQWFNGDLLATLSLAYEFDYQQRNALLVGTALGIAIIPTIFTVAEDAINAVPKPMASGSLALGASQWLSFRTIVFPIAAPGIFAAVLLGFGRAVGETMILLLLSGNAANADWNPLIALRSVAATLAIEMPDAPVEGSHFHVLIVGALALFAISFIVNTLAQLLKRRLTKHRVYTV